MASLEAEGIGMTKKMTSGLIPAFHKEQLHNQSAPTYLMLSNLPSKGTLQCGIKFKRETFDICK